MTAAPSAKLLSAALFERDGKALVARRKAGRAPLAGQWLLPLTRVRDDETAEEALRRHVREQFGVGVSEESFAETAYVEDPADRARYVTNIFRASTYDVLRFRADGDYDDARWLSAGDLPNVWMPPSLRDPLVALLSKPAGDAQAEGPAGPHAEQPVPLAERVEEPAPAEETLPPDNRASWEAISAAYQRERYGDRDAGRLQWSWGLFEEELQLLGDVRGCRALVLGCGGGQDAIALAHMGAIAAGIDISPEQIAYARRYALRHGAETSASFVEGNVEDLSRFDDASFDLAVSIHALGYVECVDLAMQEAARVLKPGGVLAIAVPHPFDQTISDDPPYQVARPYWDGALDWEWTFAGGESARFRDWRRTLSEWFDVLTSSGFAVERMIEPRQNEAPEIDESRRARFALIPYVLIIKARKR